MQKRPCGKASHDHVVDWIMLSWKDYFFVAWRPVSQMTRNVTVA